MATKAKQTKLSKVQHQTLGNAGSLIAQAEESIRKAFGNKNVLLRITMPGSDEFEVSIHRSRSKGSIGLGLNFPHRPF